MRFTRNMTAALMGVAMLLFAPSAFAQTSAQNGYSTPGGVVQTQVTPPASTTAPATTAPSVTTQSSPATATTPKAAPVATTEAKTSGKLPFTGLDLALVVIAGAVLLAIGLGIRRLSRSVETV